MANDELNQQYRKKVINYYYSFHDISKDLNDKQFRIFNTAIFSVMFYEQHINDVIFDDKMLNILWKSVRHSIKASLDGYCSRKKIKYNNIFTPLTKGVEKCIDPLSNNENENENGNENKATFNNVTKDESLYSEFSTIYTLQTQELKRHKTDKGKSRRNSGTKSEMFSRYERHRKKYSYQTISIIVRGDMIGKPPKDLMNILGKNFPDSFAKSIEKQDKDILNEVLQASDKDFENYIEKLEDATWKN